MKFVIILLFVVAGYFYCESENPSQTPEPYSFGFAGSKCIFPATVRQAVNREKLDYKPPGYYYKTDKKGVSIILDYHFKSGDFSNEYQPKSTLYGRDVHSYNFQFPDTGQTYDSLKGEIEKKFNKQFILTKGLKDSEYAIIKEFEFNLLTINQWVTVGIKRSKSEERRNLVTVRFMYNLPLGRMGVVMGND